MRTYIIRRVLLLIPTFLLLTVLVFLSVRFLPGDAVDFMMARLAAAEGHGGMVHLDREKGRATARAGCAGARAIRTLAGRHLPARHPG